MNQTAPFSLWWISICGLLFEAARLGYTFIKFSFYNVIPLKSSSSLGGIAILLSLVNIIGLGVQDNEHFSSSNLVYIQMMITVLIIKLCSVAIHWLIEFYRALPNSQIKSEYDAMKKLFALIYTLEQVKIRISQNSLFDVNEMKTKGVLAYYRDQLDFSFARVEKEDVEKLTPQKCAEMIQEIQIHTIFSTMKRIKSSNNLKLSVAGFLVKTNKDPIMAIKLLQDVQKSKGLRYIAKRFIRQMEDRINHENISGKNAVDIRSFIDFQIVSDQFTNEIFAASQASLRFWETFEGPNLGILDLFKMSKRIESSAEAIQSIWDKSIEPEASYSKPLANLYVSYLQLVRNRPQLALKIKKNFINPRTSKTEKIDFVHRSNLYDPENVIFNISMTGNWLGKVIYTSVNVEELLGWSHKELMGHSIVAVMPQSIRGMYEILLSKFPENPDIFQLTNNRDTILLNKKGECIPCFLLITIYPFLQDEINFTVIARAKAQTTHHIYIRPDGVVEGLTGDISRKLNVPKDRRIHIHEICKNYQELGINFVGYEPMSSGYSKNSSQKETKEKVIGQPERKDTEELGMPKKQMITVELYDLKDFPEEKPVNTFQYQGKVSQIEFANQTVFHDLTLNFHPEEVLEKEKDGLEAMLTEIEGSEVSIPIEVTRNPMMTTEFTPTADKLTSKIFFETQRSAGAPLLTHQISLNTDHRNQIAKGFERKNQVNSDMETEGKEEIPEDKSPTKIESTYRYLEDDDNFSKFAGSRRNRTGFLENKVYMIPKDRRIRFFKIFVVLIVLSCSGLLAGLNVRNKSLIQKISANTQIITYSTRALVTLIDIYSSISKVVYVEKGYILDDRLLSYVPISFKSFQLEKAYASSQNLLEYINLLYSVMNSIDVEFQGRFFERVPFEKDGIQTDTLYINIMANIANAGKGLFNHPFGYNYTEDNDVKMILSDSVNSILSTGGSVVNIVVDDNTQKISRIKSFLLLMTVLGGVFSFSLVAIFILLITKFLRDRKMLMSPLLRLEKRGIRDHVLSISNFCHVLQISGMDGRRLKNKVYHTHKKIKTSAPKDGQINKSRQASKRGINRKTFLLLFLSIALMLFLFAGFIAQFPVSSRRNTVMSNQIEIIVEAGFSQFYSLFLTQQTYDYIAYNDTKKILNVSISEQWNETVTGISQLQARFMEIVSRPSDYSENSDILEVLLGNLCEYPGLFDGPEQLCPIYFSGLAEKGLIQVSQFLLEVFKNTKKTFDMSQRTFQDSFDALGMPDFVLADLFAPLVWMPSFEKISTLMGEQLEISLYYYNNLSEDLAITWGVFYTVFGFLGWMYIISHFQREKESWRKMLRLVPFPLIVKNKLLRGYLKRTQKEL